MDYLPQIVILVILLAGSAFFSASETALTTVNRIQLQLLADEGNKRAKKTLLVLDRSEKMLSAILIGNNIVNLAASALATTLTIKIAGNAWVGLITGILTVIILFFGEIIPKSLASAYSLKLSNAFSGIIYAFMVILTPIIFIVELVKKCVLRLFKVDLSKVKDTMTEEELKSLVDVSFEEGAIEGDEFEMISNVFSLDDSIARDIMVPRADIIFVQADATYDEVIETFREHGHTRYPVYDEDYDTIIGMLNIKDLLLVEDHEDFKVRDVLREPHFTFEHKEVGTLLIEMREAAISTVIVLDEYGSTSGMIAFENIVEEIVGDIRDEFDQSEHDEIVEKTPGKEYVVDGSTNLLDVNDELGTNFESEEYDTIGGYIIEYLDRLPKNGEKIETEDGITIIAELVKRNRIEKVHIFLNDKEE